MDAINDITKDNLDDVPVTPPESIDSIKDTSVPQGAYEDAPVDVSENIDNQQRQSENGELVYEQDSDKSHAQSQQTEQEPIEDKRTNQSIKNKLNHARREYFRASEQANILEQDRQRLIQENEILKQKMQIANNAAVQFGDDSAALRIETARQKLSKAIESGDIQGQVDAQTEISLATGELQRFNSLKAQQELQKQQEYYQPNNQYNLPPSHQSPPQPTVASFDEQARVYDWVDQNPWFDNKSPDFDPKFAHHMDVEIDEFNRQLINMGRGNMIYSQQYFDALDAYVNEQRGVKNQGGQIPMRNNNNNFMAPSKGSQSSSVARTTPAHKRDFSKDAKNLIRDLGVTDDMFRKAIKDTQEADKIRGRRQ